MEILFNPLTSKNKNLKLHESWEIHRDPFWRGVVLRDNPWIPMIIIDYRELPDTHHFGLRIYVEHFWKIINLQDR